jgi:hypothetical protein
VKVLKIKDLKQIIMNLDDSYDVEMEEQQDKVDTIQIKGVEISLETKQVIFKNW